MSIQLYHIHCTDNEIEDPTILSAGPGTSTAALAGLVPKEPRREAQVIPSGDGSAGRICAYQIASSMLTMSSDNAAIQSVGPNATTAALAGQVPKEPRKEAQVLSENAEKPAAAVPEVVQESIADAKTGAEAAANAEAVQEKSAVESELLKDVKPSQAQGEPAPTVSAATASKAPEPTESKAPAAAAAGDTLTPPAKDQEPASRDVSPLSHPKGAPAGAGQPVVTDGPTSTSVPAKTEASTNTPASQPTVTDKKAKRASFFGKLKEKFKH